MNYVGIEYNNYGLKVKENVKTVHLLLQRYLAGLERKEGRNQGLMLLLVDGPTGQLESPSSTWQTIVASWMNQLLPKSSLHHGTGMKKEAGLEEECL